jgi:TolB-like protein/DNA-binding SARP family transcriptional activator
MFPPICAATLNLRSTPAQQAVKVDSPRTFAPMYRLRTFGRLAIERDGVSLDDVGISRKALAIVAVLAAQGSTARERLMALLWADSDATRARGSLNQALHLIRRQLGHQDILLGAAELRLNPDLIDSDVAQFLEALTRDDLAAINLYSDSFLDGVHVDGAPEFERWAAARNAELSRLFAEALERLASIAEVNGAFPEAVQLWRRYQVVDPLNGRIAVRLMSALAASGDLPGALRHAQLHQRRLQDEWDMGPDPDVANLVEQLRSGNQGDGHRNRLPSAGAPPNAPAPAREHRPNTGAPRQIPARPHHPFYFPALVAAILIAVGAGAVLLISRLDTLPKHPITAVVNPSPGSIAILPFDDLSPARDQEHFSSGMTEELITMLAKVDGLRVAARGSAFRFRGADVDLREVRESLGVAHVLVGSVRRNGDRVRVSVQLVDTSTGFHDWSETYDRTSGDFFALQSEISSAIIRTLQIRLTEREGERLIAAPTSDFEAYEMYLRGLHFFGRLQIPAAIEHLTAATNRDPGFARAYASLAESYGVPAAYSDRSPHENRASGIKAAQEALRLDPNLADAHYAMGWLEMIGLRWEEAGRFLREAVALDGRAPRARLYHALYLHRRGMVDAAISRTRAGQAAGSAFTFDKRHLCIRAERPRADRGRSQSFTGST